MHNRIQTHEIGNFNVSRVLDLGRHPKYFAARREGAARVEITIKADHVVSCTDQHRRENGPDVAQMTRYQHTHSRCSPFACSNLSHAWRPGSKATLARSATM